MPPIEQMLKLLGGQMRQHSVIGLDGLDEHARQPIAPELEERAILGRG